MFLSTIFYIVPLIFPTLSYLGEVSYGLLLLLFFTLIGYLPNLFSLKINKLFKYVYLYFFAALFVNFLRYFFYDRFLDNIVLFSLRQTLPIFFIVSPIIVFKKFNTKSIIFGLRIITIFQILISLGLFIFLPSVDLFTIYTYGLDFYSVLDGSQLRTRMGGILGPSILGALVLNYLILECWLISKKLPFLKSKLFKSLTFTNPLIKIFLIISVSIYVIFLTQSRAAIIVSIFSATYFLTMKTNFLKTLAVTISLIFLVMNISNMPSFEESRLLKRFSNNEFATESVRVIQLKNFFNAIYHNPQSILLGFKPEVMKEYSYERLDGRVINLGDNSYIENFSRIGFIGPTLLLMLQISIVNLLPINLRFYFLFLIISQNFFASAYLWIPININFSCLVLSISNLQNNKGQNLNLPKSF